MICYIYLIDRKYQTTVVVSYIIKVRIQEFSIGGGGYTLLILLLPKYRYITDGLSWPRRPGKSMYIYVYIYTHIILWKSHRDSRIDELITWLIWRKKRYTTTGMMYKYICPLLTPSAELDYGANTYQYKIYIQSSLDNSYLKRNNNKFYLYIFF